MDQKWVTSFDRLGRQVLEKLRKVSKPRGLGREEAGILLLGSLSPNLLILYYFKGHSSHVTTMGHCRD